MLEFDNDLATSKSGPIDLDEIVIAAGFIHPRATGWLDREGSSWLRAALLRSDQNHSSTDVATMLHDLATYPNEPPGSRKSTPKRARIRIRTGAGDRQLTRWGRQTEQAMARDRAWSAWWATTPFTMVDFFPALDGVRDSVALREDSSGLVVLASTPHLGRIACKHLGGIVTGNSRQLPSLMSLPDVRSVLDGLLLSALHTAASRLQLQTPPAHLPPLQAG